MANHPSLVQRYKQLNFWNKFGFWGSVASFIGLVLTIIFGVLGLMTSGGTSSLVELAKDPIFLLFVALLVSMIIVFWFSSFRLGKLLRELHNTPEEQRALLINQAFGGPIPENISPMEWKSIKRDRYIIVAFLGVLALIALGMIFSFSYAGKKLDTDKVGKERDQLRSQIDEIQKELLLVKERDRAKMVLAAELSGRAAVVVHLQPTPAVIELSSKLKELVSLFQSSVPANELTEEDSLRIKIANGLIANAEGRYKEALDLVTAADADAERKRTEAQISREFELVSVRADSYYSLNKWMDALRAYNRLIQLRPADVGVQAGKARCLYHTGDLIAAKTIWDALLPELLSQHKHGNEKVGLEIAAALANRAEVLAELGRSGEAIPELTAAIDMFMRLSSRENTSRSYVSLVQTLILRAGILADKEDYGAAEIDFQNAELLCKRLIEQDKSGTFTQLMASVLHDRGTIYIDMGRESDGLRDLNKATELRSRIVNQQGGSFKRDELAETLIARATVFSIANDNKRGLGDIEKAINLLESSIREDNRDDLRARLAAARRLRGEFFLALGEFNKAISDVQTAIAILKELPSKEQGLAIYFERAATSALYGRLLVANSERMPKEKRDLLEAASNCFSTALGNLKVLKEKTGAIQYRINYAKVLSDRSIPLYRLGRRDEAQRDTQEACAILEKHVQRVNCADSRLNLAKCRSNLGLGYVDNGKMEEGLREIGHAVSLLRQLASEGRQSASVELALLLQVRGRIFGNAKQKDEAIRDLDESAKLLNEAISREGKSRLQPHLDRTLRHRREAEEGKPLGELPPD